MAVNGGQQMIRLMGMLYAAIAAIVIATAPISTVQAAPAFAGSGNLVRDAVPNTTETVRWGGRRGGFRGGGFRRAGIYRGGYRGGYGGYRPARAYYGPRYRRVYRAPVYYGRRCFIRPGGWVWTAYGQVYRPARRVCRY
jgi:hypothetical protein